MTEEDEERQKAIKELMDPNIDDATRRRRILKRIITVSGDPVISIALVVNMLRDDINLINTEEYAKFMEQYADYVL